MAKEKRHYVTEQEIAEVMEKNKCSRDEAEFYFIDKYEEAIFPDEYDKADEVIANLKANLKNANVYDNSKGKRKAPERKPDEDKRFLINLIAEKLANDIDLNVVNIEREITFTYNDFEYSLVLTKHRKGKDK